MQLREEVALVQHHDGITGTSKYWVHDDVVKRIQGAIDRCRKDIEFLSKLLYFNEEEEGVTLMGNHNNQKLALDK